MRHLELNVHKRGQQLFGDEAGVYCGFVLEPADFLNGLTPAATCCFRHLKDKADFFFFFSFLFSK